MRRPQLLNEKKDVERLPIGGSSGALSRMRRFLSESLGRVTHSSPTYRDVPGSSSHHPSSQQSLLDLKYEGQSLLGKPLEIIMNEEEKDVPYGVPSFVHQLCRYMLDYGVSYETLFEERSGRTALFDPTNRRVLRSERENEEAITAAELFRLFLDELPHPLMCERTVSTLMKMYKDIENFTEVGSDLELFEESAYHIRGILLRMLPWHSLQFLQYLTAFLHQLLTSNQNSCPVTASSLSRLLGRVLTKDDTSHVLAKMLLVNYTIIFQDLEQFAQEKSYSSDSISSSAGTDSADLYTPEDEDGVLCGGSSLWPPSSELPDDSSPTSTTTDTEEFRSPPVSPLKMGPGSCHTSFSDRRPMRSTEEFNTSGSKGDFISSKYSPYSQKKYLPSITGLLDSSYNDSAWLSPPPLSESRKYDSQTDESYETTSFDGSFASGEVASDSCTESESEVGGATTDGKGIPCPHEERRFSERLIRRAHRSNTTRGSNPKRKSRRKHSKNSEPAPIVSSEDEEDNDGRGGSLDHDSEKRESSIGFSHLLGNDPAPYEPEPSADSFTALLTSSDPVIRSNRIPIGHQPVDGALEGEEEELEDFEGEERLTHNWMRTAPHFSRSVDENWHRTEDLTSKKSRLRTGSLPQQKSSMDDWTNISAVGSSSLKRLTKSISSIKRKIKKFEEEFETSFGYRPSHSDKMKHKEVKKYMSDLSKAKKELRHLKDEILEKKKDLHWPKAFPMSLLRCQESTSQDSSSSGVAAALSSEMTRNTFKKVEECLNAKRTEANRPMEVKDLSLPQLLEEKSDIQRALLFYESMHGRPSNKEAKELVKPLYDRYRIVKRSVNKVKLRQKDSMIELAPILEHVAMDFTLASPQHRGSLKDNVDDQEPWESALGDSVPLNQDPHPEVNPTPTLSPTAATTPILIPGEATAGGVNSSSSSSFSELNLGDLHALPLHELKERRKEARDEKKTLRHYLREFEERFEKDTGRKMQKEDRGSMEKTYNEYKHVKAKLRLLEALLSKHSAS